MTDIDPDYVVLGETRFYSFEAITKAIRLINAGAQFIATNPDATGPSAEGALPATGAVAALITRATSREPYIVGKPNPMMFRSALNKLGVHSEGTGMIGDRMDTNIVAGMAAGLHTVLVLADGAEIICYPFRSKLVIDSVADLLDHVSKQARAHIISHRRTKVPAWNKNPHSRGFWRSNALEIPSGVSSGLHRGRVRSLENSLEANHADDSRSISSADRHSRRSWRNFHLLGIKQVDLAGDSSVAL
ncbi:HAD hydrolase-like protein [Rhizobium sp. AN5]|uniref:HAD hydrolase-like protein n=1 Tax=Rhizobium sp. AN5 TaxID=1855304 RepID=UPI002691C1A1|nr:HAD hydrolase-like protein [Rhizobium sp. AN5]